MCIFAQVTNPIILFPPAIILLILCALFFSKFDKKVIVIPVIIFIICIISSISVCVGYKYRLSIILFFISFLNIWLFLKVVNNQTNIQKFYIPVLIITLLIYSFGIYLSISITYSEFPKGLKVTFYDDNGKENKVFADYGIFYKSTKIVDLKKNVKLISNDGSELFTQQLFWDAENEWLFTEEQFTFKNAGWPFRTSSISFLVFLST